ncbi:MAG: outer membrane beta-barrel protein [Bacteroidia bacterium]
MLKNYPVLILLCFGLGSYSQNSIKGIVTDSTQSPMAFCPMVLLKASDSSQVKGNISDSVGSFIFEKVKPGIYFIKFNAVGYRSASSGTFSIDSVSKISLPTVILGAQGVNLNEVSVSVYKPTIEFKKGTVIMNVENDILARGNTVFDLLKRLPGVIIDAQNNITINGAGGVRFLIDDRMQQMPTPQVMDMLAGMSADAVSKIELIKNPPARYDAAGTGGLINIVTKRAKINGYNGNIALGASQGKRFRVGPNGSFNYKSKKLSFFSNFSYGYWNGINDNTLKRNIIADGNTESINSYGTHESFQRVFSGSGGIEYDITKTTLIGLYINGNANNDLYVNSTGTQVDNSTFFNYNKTNSKINDKYNTGSPSINLSLLQKIDTTGGQIKLRLGYNNYFEKEVKNITNHFYDANDFEVAPVSGYDNNSSRSFNVYTGKLDVNKTFKNKFALESGLSANIEDDYSNTKLQFSNQSTGFFVGDTTFYNIYKFKQNLLAAYSTVSRSWEKFGFSLGLRAEQTDVNIDYISNKYFYKRNYINLFPSGSLDFNLDKKNSITIAYSYRIRRPNYGMLNPVRQFNEQLNYNVGNPEIRPQFSHNFTLDYNYNKFITVSAGHDETKDFTFWYSYTPASSRVNIDTISNLPRFTNTYVSLSAQKRIKWYSFQTYCVLTHQTFQGQLIGQDVSSQTNQLYFNLNQEFYLPKDFKIQIWAGRGSAIRHGPQVYLPRSAIHISVNKTFLNQKLNVTLALNDVLYKDYFSYTTTYTNQNFYMKDLADTRRVRITVSYRFGKMQIQQRLNTEAGQGIKAGK